MTSFSIISTTALTATVLLAFAGQPDISWLILLVYFAYWQIRKKPLRRTIVYDFSLCKFSVSVKRW